MTSLGRKDYVICLRGESLINTEHYRVCNVQSVCLMPSCYTSMVASQKYKRFRIHSMLTVTKFHKICWRRLWSTQIPFFVLFYILMFFPRLSVATFSFNCIPISLLSVLNHEREWVWAIPWQKTSNSQATPATAPFAGWSPLNWRLFSCPPIWKWG